MRRTHLLVTAMVTALVIPGVVAPAQAAALDNLTEGFGDITTLPAAGWNQQNLSSPLGVTGWFQGSVSVFPSQAGAPNAYIGANFNNTSVGGTISNWLLTPEVALTKGSKLTFWTRTVLSTPEFPDRLEVRLSPDGGSTDVGSGATDVGDFTTVLTTVNPTLVAGVYPTAWTEFTVTVPDVPLNATGRIGFRYFVTNGGPSAANSNHIGIDTVSFQTAPTVASVAPDSGPLAGGTPVTITGTRFAPGVTATINGVTCASPTVVSATTLTCTTGPGSAGTGAAVVTNPGGLSGTGGTFTYGTPGPLTFNPTPADFGTVTTGTAATAQKVTVKNTGSIPVTPSAITTTPGEVTIDESSASRCRTGVAIPVGAECDVTLGWTPAKVGTLAGSLTIAYPDGDAPDSTLQVVGTAVPPPAKPAALGKPKLKFSKGKVKASWQAATSATSYQAVLTGKKASAKKGATSLDSARVSSAKKVTKTKTVTTTKATFKVKLKPGSKVKVCVTASNAGGTSPKACATKKVPKKKKKK